MKNGRKRALALAMLLIFSCAGAEELAPQPVAVDIPLPAAETTDPEAVTNAEINEELPAEEVPAEPPVDEILPEELPSAETLPEEAVPEEIPAEPLPETPAEEIPEESAEEPAEEEPAEPVVLDMDWWESDIQGIFGIDRVATVTDVKTGISWNVVRKSGTNHADVQPCTATDTMCMKRAAGGWSWKRRAIWVTIGDQIFAASMISEPHGQDSVPRNDYYGHFCIHFTNSRTHDSDKVCPQHQSCIETALNTTPWYRQWP